MSQSAQYGFDPYAQSDTGWFGSKLVKKIGKAVSKVPGISAITAPVNLVRDVARGKNVARSFVRAGSATVKDIRRSVPIAAQVARMVPGVGTVVAAGLSAADATLQGKKFGDILLAAGKGALPGGPLVNAAVNAMGTGLKGGNVLAIANAAAKGVVPGNIQQAVAFGADVIKGKNVINLALATAAQNFKAGTPELQGFNVAKSILTSGKPSVQQLSQARSGLQSEGARRAFDSAVGTASQVATSQRPTHPTLRQMALPRKLARLTPGRATAAFRPLAPRAAQVIAARAPWATMAALFGRRETAGLEADGASYRVENGDSAWAIAKKLVKDGNRWSELVKANPKKKTNPKDGNFATLFAGEILTLPASWRQQVAPTLKADVLSQARALLKVWSDSDGANQAGVNGYGDKPEDSSLTWGPRDRMMLVSFANWRNMTLGKQLSVVGDLSTALADELRLWASEHANAKAPQSSTVQSANPTNPPDASATAAGATTSPGWPSIAATVASTVSPDVAPAPVVSAPTIYTSAAATPSAPSDIAAMAASAQASGSLETMRRVAAEIAKRGYRDLSERLYESADKLEAKNFGTPDPTAQTIPATVIGAAPKKTAAQAQSQGGDFGPLLIGAVVVAKLADVI